VGGGKAQGSTVLAEERKGSRGKAGSGVGGRWEYHPREISFAESREKGAGRRGLQL